MGEESLPDEPPFPVKDRAMHEAPVGIAISDPDRPDNPLVYVNNDFERVTGYHREEVLGRNCRFLQGPATEEAPVADLREAIDAGERVTVELHNYRKDGEQFWNEVTVAPLRNGDGEITHYVGFQKEVTRRKEAELALADERERLDDLLTRVDAILETVTEAVVTATSRGVLERSVCEGLVGAGPYERAWILEVDPATDGLVPSTSTDGADPDRIPIEADHPIARAHRTGSIQGVPADGASTVAIPLVHGGTDRGVLAVEVAAGAAVDEREGTVLAALGRAVAAAMAVIQTRRVITADEVLEATVSVTGDAPFFVRLSTDLDCRFAYEGAVADADTPSLFFAVEDVPAGDVLGAAADDPDVAAATVVAEDDSGALFEFELERDAIVGQLAAFGAETRSIVAEGGEATVTFTLTAGADLRTVVESLQEQYPETQLRSTETRERPPETRREYFSRVESELTDRQLAALQTAFVAGYFDRPRRATGDDLAEALGVTRSTFHQHLRVAQRKLLAEFFDR